MVTTFALVASVGLSATALAAGTLERIEGDRLSRALQQRTAMISQAVTAEVGRYTTSLADLAAAVGAQSRLEAAEFSAITAVVDRRRLPGATGLALVVRTGDTAGTQRHWRRLGASDLTLRPSGPGPHWFAVLTKALDRAGPPSGVDLSTSPEAVEAMRLAGEGRGIRASRGYGPAAAPGRPQLSFVLAAPVYATSPVAPDYGSLRGWLVLDVRGQDFLGTTIAAVADDTVAVSVRDTGQEVAGWRPDVPLGERHLDTTVDVGQRAWTLRVSETRRLLKGNAQELDRVAWAVGMALTGLLLALTVTVVTSRNRALRRVAEATAALRDDIDRREKAEHRLRMREKELTSFAGVVAHDLRSPLARIMGYADFLHEETFERLDGTERELLDRLRTGTRHMQALIDDLLDYATADNRPMTHVPVDLRRLAEHVARERAAERDADVVVGDLPTVYGDPTLLCQVLDNLIGNAIKYTPPERTPRVRVRSGTAGDGRWRCEVADNGIGVPPQERDVVFDAFIRASGSRGYAGTGLGLAIVHRIVERHHGAVGIEANPLGGSIFWFTLPAGDPALADGAAARCRPNLESHLS